MAARRHEAGLAHLSEGRAKEAIAALQEALALDGKMARAHSNLGVALRQVERFDEAEAAYRDALRVDPTHAPAHHNLGDLLHFRGRLDEARGYFESALRIDPASGRTRLSLANTLTQLGNALVISGQFVEAARKGREALSVVPRHSTAWLTTAGALVAAGDLDAALQVVRESGPTNVPTHQLYGHLGAWLLNSGMLEPARLCLEAALHEEPGDSMASHLLQAVRGANPEQPAEGYVRKLFDGYAPIFDSELVSKLGYAIPRELVAELRGLDNQPAPPWNVLDLGCGTGLLGVEIAPFSRSLVGVDIAPNMLDHARGREIYSSLHCADLTTALREDNARGARYDVVTAADVLIYLGKLDVVIPEIRGVLQPGGLLGFSCEALEDTGEHHPEDYRLSLSGRYEHRADYLRRLAAQHRFDVLTFRKVRARFESGKPVESWLTVWRAN